MTDQTNDIGEISDQQKNDMGLLLAYARKPGDTNTVLIRTKDVTGKPVTVIAIVEHTEDGGMQTFPVARMFEGDPFEELVTPEGATIKEDWPGNPELGEVTVGTTNIH